MKKKLLILFLATLMISTLAFAVACGSSNTSTTSAMTTKSEVENTVTTSNSLESVKSTSSVTPVTNPTPTESSTVVVDNTSTPTTTTKPSTETTTLGTAGSTTAKIPETNSNPTETTVKTEATTTPSIKDTVSPTTTAKPVITTAKPVVTTAKPIVTTAKPIVTTAKPVATTAKPVVTTKKPVVTTQTPVTTTVVDTTPTIPEPAYGTQIRIKYEVNNSYAGKLEGSSSQYVYYGMSSSQLVSVTTNLGYKFVGWSDGKTTSTRSGDCPRENTTYTAIFEFDAQELPILELYTDNGKDITDKVNYTSGTISVHNAPNDDFNFEDLAMEIRGRGNFTWNSTFKSDPMYNKRPYRIKLSKKMNLLGQGNGKAKNWVLIANHCDQSLLRNQTVYQFAQTMTGIVWQPSAQSVEVFLNGQYIGVYMLTEQVQINSNRIDLSEDTTGEKLDFLLHYSNYAFDDSNNDSFYYDGKPYEIVSDLSTDSTLYNKQLSYIQGRIGECWDAVKRGNKDEILSLMDINSVIDTLIVHELFKNLDTGHDNFYMFASIDSKLFFGPVWDFDQCAGNADVGVESFEGIRGTNTNVWYAQFIKNEWFKEMLLERWEELMKEDIPAIPDKIRASARAGYNSYCRNFDKWKILGYTDKNGNKQLGYKINREMNHIRIFQTYDEHYEYFAYWMEERIVWLNNYYHSSEFLVPNAKLELKGEGTQASPYLITSAQDFYNFTLVMAGGETFAGKYFKQTANIDMTTLTYYSGVANPNVFAGTYDGAGHTIHAVIKSNESSFFPYLTGTVMNLVTTGTVQNSGHAGGICRSVRKGGLILNCGSTVTVSSSGGNAGGLAPSNQDGGGSIIGCWFAGKILSGNMFSPMVVYYNGRETGTIKNNYYISNFYEIETTQEPTVNNENETAIEATALATLHNVLNQNLEANAALAGVDKNKLCSWKVENGIPTLISK